MEIPGRKTPGCFPTVQVPPPFSPGPRPQTAPPGRTPLPSLQMQAPSMGEQAMAFSQEQREEQLSP